jgi:2',3'-cyclic-nucleotide 2'-phosphodiesterase (5'-nucleotidase family)
MIWPVLHSELRWRKKMRVFLGMCVMAMILYPAWLRGGGKPLTLLHTNDLHSHLLGFSPNIDYSPIKKIGDATTGGWSGIAAVIKSDYF